MTAVLCDATVKWRATTLLVVPPLDFRWKAREKKESRDDLTSLGEDGQLDEVMAPHSVAAPSRMVQPLHRNFSQLTTSNLTNSLHLFHDIPSQINRWKNPKILKKREKKCYLLQYQLVASLNLVRVKIVLDKRNSRNSNNLVQNNLCL